MDNEIYFQFNPWWENDFESEGLIERSQYLKQLHKALQDKTIVLLTGLRRVGKTTLLKLLIRDLIRQNIPPKQLFYVSLDDYSLEGKSILDIVDDYRKLHRVPVDKKIFLFLDELGHKEKFHQQLKNIYDRQNVKIFASSSSSSVLRDRKAYLTGRETVMEILPLDFEEYCSFKGTTIKKRDVHLLESYFDDYLKTGGMPEYVLYQDRAYLTGLVDDIIYKDIVAFHGIKNHQGVRDYFALLMERAGKQFSVNKIANILSIAPDTANRYMRMFEDTYLIHLISRYGKANDKILSPKKIYAADLGIRHLFTGFRDKGAVFENYVYLKIRASDPRYLYENGIEIDFFTREKTLIEVKYGGELTAKQQELFDKTKAAKKLVIKGFSDLQSLAIMNE